MVSPGGEATRRTAFKVLKRYHASLEPDSDGSLAIEIFQPVTSYGIRVAHGMDVRI